MSLNHLSKYHHIIDTFQHLRAKFRLNSPNRSAKLLRYN